MDDGWWRFYCGNASEASLDVTPCALDAMASGLVGLFGRFWIGQLVASVTNFCASALALGPRCLVLTILQCLPPFDLALRRHALLDACSTLARHHFASLWRLTSAAHALAPIGSSS